MASSLKSVTCTVLYGILVELAHYELVNVFATKHLEATDILGNIIVEKCWTLNLVTLKEMN